MGFLQNTSVLAPATPAVNVLKSTPTQIFHIQGMSIAASAVWLKLFDVSGSVTLGTTLATWQLMIPGATGGTGFIIDHTIAMPMTYQLAYAVTGGIAFNDNTAISANTVVVNFSFT